MRFCTHLRRAEKSPLTWRGKFHILASSRVKPSASPTTGGACQPTETVTIHVDGSASGDPATTRFLRTAKRSAARKEVSGTLRTNRARQPLRSRTRGDRAATERPIAPGKVSCPSPPWDAAFPGAFFARRSHFSLQYGILPHDFFAPCIW